LCDSGGGTIDMPPGIFIVDPTAIEIHKGSGSVSGNTINFYSFGMNLVDLDGATVIGNSVRNAAYGISLWCGARWSR